MHGHLEDWIHLGLSSSKKKTMNSRQKHKETVRTLFEKALTPGRVALIFLIAMISNTASGNAQPCLRYNQKDSCSSYPVTDFIVSAPLPGANGGPARHLDLATNVGWLFNVHEKTALGPAFFFSAYLNGGWNSQLGAQGRVRYWINPNVHLDISPGVIIHDNPYPDGFAGYMGEVSIGYRDWISIAARLDRVKVYPHGRDTIFQIGVKFGSYIGMGLTGMGAVAGGVGYILSRID